MAPQTDLAIIIPPARQGDRPLILYTVSAIESSLLNQSGYHALIGRDVLAECTLVYDGPNNRFALTWE